LPKTAIFWIRDGVLIDRMAVNAVAFAFACLCSLDNENSSVSLTSLVNFAFDRSGISCAEKINRLNNTNTKIVADVQVAVDLYNHLASSVALHCEYFSGAKQLLEKTQELGCLNFISSAVDQAVLNDWETSEQALTVLPFLTEILGWRSPDISKGRGHFNYVYEKYEVERIIYIADAVTEVADGHKNSNEFGVLPIGFANMITPEKVATAFDLVLEALLAKADLPSGDLFAFTLEFEKLMLPDQVQLEASLKDAGAAYIVGGLPEDIMGNLNLLLANQII
jgi:hypothetical protein